MSRQLSEDLAQFRTIILSLISYTNHPKLDLLIEKLTPDLYDSKRFLIKMEIKRLSKPCSLVMDFRTYFDNCEPVQHQNICHYLDTISKTLFLTSVEKNSGLFSIHLYNELSEKAKERHRKIVSAQRKAKAHSKIAIDQVQQLSLVNDNFFDEPQITGKSKCRLFSYDPLGLSQKGKLEVGVEVNPLDINANGCVIKAPLKAIADTNKAVFIWFYDHDKALNFQQEIVLNCSVEDHKQTQSARSSHYLLKVNQASENRMRIALSDLLAKRVELTNKSQSKQIQPLIASINAKCHEQFLLSNTLDIPMLCSKYQTGWRPSISLQTPSNLDLWQFFSDDNSYDPLDRLFCNRALQAAIKNGQEFDDYAYVLKHQYPADEQTKQQFIIIWQSQLENDSAANSFLTKHILNGNYRYLRLRMITINAQQDAHVPSALPDYISPAMALLNRPHNNKIATLLKASTQLAILTDITELNDVLALPDALAVKEVQPAIKARLKCPEKFVLAELPSPSTMEVVSINHNDLRTEDRFEYELALTLTQNGKQSINIKGNSKNISTRGMLIELVSPVRVKPGANLQLKVEIPYRGQLLTMPNQAYQLLSIQDERFLRLVINGPEAKHAACQALRELIYRHMDKLPHCGFEQGSIFGLQKAMRNIYANNHLSVPFFIHQDKRQWHISSVAMNQHTQRKHFHDEEVCTKYLLLKMVEQEKFRNYCLSLLNKVEENTPVQVFYILTIPRKSPDSEQLTFWFSDMKQLQKNGKLNGVLDKIRSIKKPSILRVQLSKPNKIVDKYFRDELNYLEQISSDSAQELTNAMTLMTGIGEITDHTSQVFHLFDHYIGEQTPAYFI